MKNKVDVRKLIKKKYSDNTLELPDLLEEIDLVLNETEYNYTSKLNTKNLPEGNSDPGHSANIYQRMYGAGRTGKIPAELGYRDNVSVKPSVIPTTVAEAGETKSSKNIEPVTVTVPDLFSLVSNQNMQLDSPERLMINDIISNFKVGNWIDKAKELQNFINDPIKLQGNDKDMGMRKAISSLMYISLLKKISFFIAQPGKLFEYIIAPLIGHDAKVAGSTDQDIIDIQRVANNFGYSVKFFTGKTSSFDVKGSYESLEKAIAKDPQKAITYIIAASSVENKTLELVELNITSNLNYFNGYSVQAQYIDGTLYKKDGIEGVFGVFIRNKQDREEFRKQKAAEAAKKEAEKEEAKAAAKAAKAAEKAARASEPKLLPTDEVLLDNIKYTVEQLKEVYKQLERQFNNIRPENFRNDLEDKLKNTKISGNFSPLLKQQLVLQDNPESLKQFIKNYKAKIVQAFEEAKQQKITQPQSQQTELEESLYEVEGDAEQAQTEPEIEEPQKQEKTNEFNIPLKGQWKNFSKIELKFQDVSTYNQFALELSNDIQFSMANALNAFSKLGTNLTKYLGTERPKEGQKENYAQLCIENTVTIEENIMNIAGQEGDKITKKK